jgi:CDP-glucose 4,6-dehydratase
MGGYDPYSSSKGAAELVVSAYRRSFFAGSSSLVRLASARAGNVIGGGDWAVDRIVPDCIRSLQRGESVPVRNKLATRPWQHVMEPLSGYLWLAACLSRPELSPLGHQAPLPEPSLSSGFNFGPALGSNQTVAALVEEVLKHWPGHWEDRSDPNAVHEAKLLNLATDKAHHFLNWSPVWDFSETIMQTVGWYHASNEGADDPHRLTLAQIEAYVGAARSKGLRWAAF